MMKIGWVIPSVAITADVLFAKLNMLESLITKELPIWLDLFHISSAVITPTMVGWMFYRGATR